LTLKKLTTSPNCNIMFGSLKTNFTDILEKTPGSWLTSLDYSPTNFCDKENINYHMQNRIVNKIFRFVTMLF